MWTFVTQPALATAGVDFTYAVAPLLIGLVGVVWFSAAMLGLAALQDFWGRKSVSWAATQPTPPEYRAAA